MTAVAMLHPFEEAGLGIGPFRCTGMTERRMPITGQPAGSCDYCGTGILFCFHIVSSDGKHFIVGSDCVMRTGGKSAGDAMTIEVRRLVKEQQREQREAKRQKEWGKFVERWNAARLTLAASPLLFTDRPHPNEYFWTQGKTLRDYYEFILKCGGANARADAIKAIEASRATPAPREAVTPRPAPQEET